MYNCKCKVYSVSGSGNIASVIGSLPPEEDLEYEIFTVSGADDTAITDTNETVVIIDGNSVNAAEILRFKDFGKLYRIVCINSDRLAELSDDMLACCDDVWPIPPKDSERFIEIYAKRVFGIIKDNFDMRRYKICLETAIDSLPDLIWFKDMRGAHLMVNNGFCKATEKTKEQTYKAGHYYIWDISADEYSKGDYVCLESEEIVLRAGETCLFDEKVKTKYGMRLFKTYKSPLKDENGEYFGTCGMARDVTDIQNVNDELTVVLDSVPFAVIVEDMRGNTISANSKFYHYFPDCTDIIGKSSRLWEQHANIDVGLISDESLVAEITVPVDGYEDERILVLNEAPIVNVFGETIGNVKVFRDITNERTLARQAVHNANTDFLTGLNNRRSLFIYLESIKNSKQLTFITVDLDNFKAVNDLYGHQAGDEALKVTSDVLTEIFHDDFAARLGGDEFFAVSNRELSDEEIEKLSSDLLDMLCSNFVEREEMKKMSASIGVAVERFDVGETHNIDALIQKSDKALYEAKNSGKAQYKIVYINSADK